MRKKIISIVSVFITFILISCGQDTKADLEETVTSGYIETTSAVSGSSPDAWQDTLAEEPIKYQFNGYKPVMYKDVVWTAMSEKVPEEDYEEFCEYLPVLTGETAVHWQAASDNSEETVFRGSDHTIQDVSGEVMSVSFWDMTRDGVKELVLETQGVDYSYIIIHKEENEFYGDAYVHRWFQSPQKSGYFWVGKGSGYWNNLTFMDHKFQMKSMAGIEQKTNNEMDIEEMYYIQNKKVSKKKYKEWEKENLTGEIQWYELPEREEA